MNTPDLGGLREGESVTAAYLSPADAAALNATGLVVARPEGDGWRVTARYAVGAVRAGGTVVRVAPKVGVLKVLTLLARARGLAGFHVDQTVVDVAGDADVSAVLAVLFEREAARAFAAGPLRGYRTEDQALPVLRGRLRMRDQFLRRHGLPTPLEVTLDEWTLDTDENRRIRAAARLLTAVDDVPPRERAGLLRIDRLLGDARLAPRGAQLAPWLPTRLNARMHGVLHLADLALATASVEHATGPVRAHGFVIDMAWVFEKLVAEVFRDECAGLVPQDSYALDTAGQLTIRPDLVFHDAAGAVAVADTKYKVLAEDAHATNADVYQLVTYCSRLGLSTGHLIYAGTAPPTTVTIDGAGIAIVTHRVDLTADLAQIESRLREVATMIVGGRRAVDASPVAGRDVA